MKTANQHSIGAVTFFHPEGETSPHYKPWCGYHPRDAQLSGQERIQALRAAYRKEPIPGGLIMYVIGGPGAITWDQVYWDSAGDRVTGE